MATLLPNFRVSRRQLKNYRVFIFSHDHPYPPHVHFGKRKRYSSWHINLLQCVDDDGFSASDIAVQRSLLVEYRDEIIKSWHEHWQKQTRPPSRRWPSVRR
jgi:hypothetical protein